jgi:alpha-N-arabinofuranosidase
MTSARLATLTLVLSATTVVPSVRAEGPAPQARIQIDLDRTIGEIHPRIFGNFAEHLGRVIYGGIYDEGSPLADSDGFRKDVMEATA